MDQVLQLEKKLRYYSISRPLFFFFFFFFFKSRSHYSLIYIVALKEKSAGLSSNDGAILKVRTKAKKLLVGQKVRPYSSKKVRILTCPELRQNHLVS